MLDLDKILNFLRAAGPTLPSKVAKNMQTDILLASALLSDLVSQGKVKITHLKVGSSPVYYLSGQEDKLYEFAAGNVKPKDMLILERLKAEKILRENDLDLLSKVGLRSLKDFAVPLHVTINGNKEVFWKWHLTPEDEMNRIIGMIISKGRHQPEEVRSEEIRQKEIKLEEIKREPAGEIKKEREEVKKEKTPETREETGNLEETLKGETKPETVKKAKSKESNARPQQKKLVEEKEEIEGKEEIKEKEDLTEMENLKKTEKNDEKKTLFQKVKARIGRKKRSSAPDSFLPLLKDFFAGLDVNIESHEIIRKNSEINLLVRVSSVVGELTYFCKAKNKSRCDEKDLSSAYMEAQIKKLPLLFLYSKEMTKKAEEMLESEAFQNAVIRKI